MSKRLTAAALAAAIAWSCGSAWAAENADADLRCLAVGLTMAGSEEPEVVQAGMLVSIFYFGRLDGKLADSELENRLFDLAMKATPEELGAAGKSCGAELQERGAAITAMGERLQARAQAQGSD